MKKLCVAFIVCLTFSFSAIAQTEVGKISNGVIEQNQGLDAYIPKLQRNLARLSNLNVSFNSVTVLEFDKQYYLQFRGGEFKTTFLVKLNSAGKLIADDGVSCTTTACSSEPQGCVPGYGSYCTPCANKGACTKTVSTVSMLE